MDGTLDVQYADGERESNVWADYVRPVSMHCTAANSVEEEHPLEASSSSWAPSSWQNPAFLDYDSDGESQLSDKSFDIPSDQVGLRIVSVGQIHLKTSWFDCIQYDRTYYTSAARNQQSSLPS